MSAVVPLGPPICTCRSAVVLSPARIDTSAPPATASVYTIPALARLLTTIANAPAAAEVCAVAVSTPASDEVAACAIKGPKGSFNAETADASLLRSALIAVNALAWYCSTICSFCQTFNGPLLWLKISLTTALTLIPCPFNKLAGLKLMPTRFSSFARRLPGVFPLRCLLGECLLDSASQAQHLRTRNL